VNSPKGGTLDGGTFGLQVQYLTTDHAGGTRAAAELPDGHECAIAGDAHGKRCVVQCAAGERYQGDTGSNGSAGAVDAVCGLLSASEIVVVHAWQVIMHEGVRVHELE
jgi:hypothetical protein